MLPISCFVFFCFIFLRCLYFGLSYVQDYIEYVTALEDRYLRKYGEVLTFGSGDCGQLAHGTDSDEDLIVKYPRIVYSLRDKKVLGIACGGLHNAVFTDQGTVYTWGCADDGSLGRGGDENLPGLVEVSYFLSLLLFSILK
jgi:regulator of chromosome condensation